MVEVTMAVVLFAGIVLCVWLDQRGRTRRRELDHVERMRALELGQPPDDAETSRLSAVGAIGVSIGISSFAAAAVATCFVMNYPLGDTVTFILLLLIWTVCALVAGGVALGCLHVLKQRGPPTGEAASQQVTTRPHDLGP